jgi:hypothetical protein
MREDPEFWKQHIHLSISYLDLMAMHGALCLALRHPQFTGPTRAMIVTAVKEIGKGLVNAGILTPEQLAETQRIEAEEGSEDLL